MDGLGNCMLITPEAGPRVRWITILTDAPLMLLEPPKMKSVVTVQNVWIFARFLPSLVRPSRRMNLEKHVMMPVNVKNIFMKRRNGKFAVYVFIFAHME